jgi:fibronectin-binding autotransporter adhesin
MGNLTRDGAWGNLTAITGVNTTVGGGGANIQGNSSIMGDLTVVGNVLPGSDDMYNLGSATRRWQSGYFGTEVKVGASVRLVAATNELEYTGGDGRISVAGASALRVSTNGMERLRVTAAGHVLPGLHNAYDLGDNTMRWRNVYGDNGDFSTLTVSGLTPGSVIFADAGGALSQDNANFFWNNVTKRLGIGTSSPAATLHVAGTGLFGGQLTVTGGGAAITGNSSIAGDLSITGNLSVTGSGAVSSNLSVFNTLSVGNGIFVSSNGITVGGGGANIVGNSSITGNLSVTGNSSITGNLSVTGSGAVSSNLTVSNTLSVGNGIFVSSNGITVGGGGANIQGNSSIMGDLTVVGNVLPGSDDMYNLGSATRRWQSGYFGEEVKVGASVRLVAATNELEYTGGDGRISVAGASALRVSTNGMERLRVTAAGHVLPGLHNAYDLGDNTMRWRNVYGDNGDFSTLTVSGLTPGSVIFADAGGALSQDNANFFWNNVTKRLGIGTSSPAATLHVAGTGLFGGQLTVTGGGAAITGNSSIAGDLSITGNLSVTGSGAVSSNLSVFNTLSVGNGIFVSSNGITVGGGGANIVGNSSITGNLSVTGNSSITGNLSVTGSGAVSSNLTVSNTLSVGNGIFVSSNGITVGGGGANIQGNSSIMGDLTVVGNVLPGSDDMYNLGSATRRWQSGYFGEEVKVGASVRLVAATNELEYTGGDGRISVAGASALRVSTNGMERLRVTAAGHVLPGLHNAYDLGDNTMRWRNVYGDNGDFSTLTVSGLTPGSVIFADAGGALSQDNANFFWNNVTKRLGIGTSSPAATLHVAGTGLFGGQLTVTGGGAAITGNSSIAGDLSITGNLSVTGSGAVSSNLSVFNTLSVGNGIFVSSNGITVGGGGATIVGNSSITGNLSVTGNSSITGNLSVTGSGAVSSNLTVSNTLSVGNGIFVSSNGITVGGGGANIQGNSSIMGDLTVVGNVLPGSDDMYNLGSATRRWQSGYFGEEVKVGASVRLVAATNELEYTGGDGRISVAGASALRVSTNGMERLRVTAAGHVLPGLHNAYDLGDNTMRWRNVYGVNGDFSTLTVSGLTPGSVIFAGAGGALSQDNANFFWDNGNKRLGIGTSSPAATLHVAGTGLFGGQLTVTGGGAAITGNSYGQPQRHGQRGGEQQFEREQARSAWATGLWLAATESAVGPAERPSWATARLRATSPSRGMCCRGRTTCTTLGRRRSGGRRFDRDRHARRE